MIKTTWWIHGGYENGEYYSHTQHRNIFTKQILHERLVMDGKEIICVDIIDKGIGEIKGRMIFDKTVIGVIREQGGKIEWLPRKPLEINTFGLEKE